MLVGLKPQLHCFLQAMTMHKRLRQLVEKLELTAKYLTRKCKEACKGWRVGPLRLKRAFPPEEKRARRAYAVEALQRPMDYWKSTIFVDEHTFYRRPMPLPAVHIAGRRRGTPPKKRARERTNRDPRLKARRFAYPKLHFLYGVHWLIGVLGPFWISDCTGWRRARHYPKKVSYPPVPT